MYAYVNFSTRYVIISLIDIIGADEEVFQYDIFISTLTWMISAEGFEEFAYSESFKILHYFVPHSISSRSQEVSSDTLVSDIFIPDTTSSDRSPG
jgi:hypothetical protein